MAQEHSIVIEIKPDGTVTGTVRGITGSACSGLSAWLNKLGQVVEDKKTADFYGPDEQGVTVSTGTGL